jgi:tryptophan synthase alpha chain
MNRLDQLFAGRPSNLLNLYFTAGYPKVEDTIATLQALQKNGADLIEIGMPYSDPLADGPTIQQSGQQALQNGMNVPLLFEQVKEARNTVDTPFILMGYFNQVMQYGEENFFRKCAETGIDGLILPDLPIYEYERFYRDMIAAYDLRISFLITPQTSESRIRKIDELSTGFIYMVSDASITGAKKGISDAQIQYFERIQAMNLESPRMIGFGISDHQSFSTACQYAQGAIIGSAYIRALANGADIEATTAGFIKSIRGENALVR